MGANVCHKPQVYKRKTRQIGNGRALQPFLWLLCWGRKKVQNFWCHACYGLTPTIRHGDKLVWPFYFSNSKRVYAIQSYVNNMWWRIAWICPWWNANGIYTSMKHSILAYWMRPEYDHTVWLQKKCLFSTNNSSWCILHWMITSPTMFFVHGQCGIISVFKQVT